MVDITALTPFSTGARYAESVLSWLPAYDQQRIAAYQVWHDIYWGQVGLVTAAASNDDPIQVPVARSIVEAIVRYLAVDWDIYLDERYGTPQARELADRTLRDLFVRESFYSKFHSQKRWGLIHGDAVWHLTADPSKPAGSRISVHVLDPSTYFPIFDADTDERIVGVHIAEPVEFDKKPAIKRQTYRRLVDDAGTVTITSELGYYDETSWDDREEALTKPALSIVEPEEVIEGLTQLPVYRIPNTVNPGDPYGSSVFRGIERVLRGIDQTITDEDLAVALAGLGFFTTDAPPPVDEDGAEKDWDIGPLRVVEVGKNAEGKVGSFNRVPGVGSVQPSQDHASYLKNALTEGASVPAVALGSVDVNTAESGIALFLRLAPLLAANAEREDVMLGIYDQMLYDLVHEWLPVFEDVDLTGVVVTSVVGDPMPTNREAKIQEIIALSTSTPPLITIQMAQRELGKLGYSFTVDDGAGAVLAQMQRQAAAVDPFAGRLSAEDVQNAPQSTDAVAASQASA